MGWGEFREVGAEVLCGGRALSVSVRERGNVFGVGVSAEKLIMSRLIWGRRMKAVGGIVQKSYRA
ncbi:hypothetical protein CL176_06930 [Suicoccus acidiformans]|uniref:Uncharacterized protein n=1 Tax=Suicoccus acidiformans TaxID=2036206 RepID=A0A347WKZ7_9LACT|nr:hypothetical protein CL176_06930 [Suicoccus acidiformans]